MLSRVGGLVVVLAATGICGAQEAPAVDLTDPVAVVQAYAKACREGDVRAALALLAPDDPARGPLQELETHPERGGPRNLADMVREYVLVPVGVQVEPEVAGATQNGDRAEVKLDAVSRSQHTFVLARQPDGTWRVKLIETLRASAPDGSSMLAGAFEQQGPRGQGGGPETWRSEQNLRQLFEAMQEYARNHGNALPPADRWVDELEPYVLERAAFRCPIPDIEACYAMNADLSGRPLPEDWTARETTALLFEWPGTERNANASARDLTQIKGPRPDGALVLVAASGQTTALQPGQKLGEWRQVEEATQKCNEHLRALVEAARKYAVQHGGMLPKAETWEADIEPYVQPPTRNTGTPQERWRSQERLQALYKAMVEYSKDHDDRLPPADRWVDELEPYLLDVEAFRCPAAPDLEYGYAMNDALSGQALPQGWEARRRLLVVFEWAGGERNAHATQDAAIAGKALQTDGILVAVTGDGNGLMLPRGVAVEDLFEGERNTSACSQNLAKLADAARKYARDNDGLFPGAATWAEDLAPYLIDAPDPNALFACPAAPDFEYAYAINEEVAGHNVAEFRGRTNTVLFFETDANEPNAAGPAVLDGPGRRRHMDYWNATEGRFDNVAYVNGEAGRGPMQPVATPAVGGESILAAVLSCPEAPGMEHPYAINAAVAGKNATELTDHGRIVLFFESGLNVPNAAGDPDRDGVGRHRGSQGDTNVYTHVGYLNGSTSRLPFVPPGGAAGPG